MSKREKTKQGEEGYIYTYIQKKENESKKKKKKDIDNNIEKRG